jgi:hypothetical protein
MQEEKSKSLTGKDGERGERGERPDRPASEAPAVAMPAASVVVPATA